MPGMCRSMITTSGATSRTRRTASAPVAASPAIWTPRSSSRLRSPVRKRSWSSTSRTRTLISSTLDWARSLTDPLSASLILVQRDRDGSAAPVTGLRKRGEPEVDRRPDHGRAGVGCDALAVARDRHARPERDHARIDRDYAPADRNAGGSAAVQGVAGRRDGHRRARRRRASTARRGNRRDPGRAGFDCLRLALERGDRRRVQALAGCERREIRGPVGASLVEPARRLRGICEEGRKRALPGREGARLVLVALPSVARLRQDEAVHVRDPAERVEPAEGLADRRRAQQNGDRVIIALLVELLNAKLERMLRRLERAAGDREPL